MSQKDISQSLQESVVAASRLGAPLCIQGGGSKVFYGRAPDGDMLHTGDHRGLVNYAPSELVITARAGTPLREIEQALDAQQQMLGFEPPYYADGATLGGTIACNLSGPRRAYAGAARDFVLGCRIINGKGEILSFGGEVMKNVAGYDVSRLMTGAMGTLGVLLEVSLKVLPKPEAEITLALDTSESDALLRMRDWARRPQPVSATCYDGASLYVRLSGAHGAVRETRKSIGGEEVSGGADLWNRIREQRHAFFAGDKPLWRLSLAPDAPALPITGKWLHEWGGALRWLKSDATADEIRAAATAHGGHATLYRTRAARDAVFQPLPAGLMELHRRLKSAFDPKGILNPGRLYAGL